MSHVTRVTCGLAMLALGLAAGAAARQAIYESTPRTLTATIEAIDTTSRIVTLKTTAGNRLHVNASDEIEGFASLRVGDVVTATYFEAIAVRLVTPGTGAFDRAHHRRQEEG